MEDKGRLAGCNRTGCKVVALIIVVFMVIGIIMGLKYNCDRSKMLEPFEAHLSEYTSIPGLKEASPTEGQYIRGKVITVDIGENELDTIYADLPADMVAANPEEVGTIIWLKWEDVEVGHYTDGATGYRIDCKVTIIDKSEAKMIGRGTLTGSDPPSAKSGSGDRHGPKPFNDVVDYLKSLPRR